MYSENINNIKWSVKILTLFPELFPGPLATSVTGRGLRDNLWSINAYNIRDYAIDKHGTVDDKPYGGGDGMVMRPDVLDNAIINTFDLNANSPIIYLSPRGKLFDQDMARSLVSQYSSINLICGRFEGVDERVLEKFNVMEISIGDYILSSGDLAAYILIDACVRNIPGLLHGESTLHEESFGDSPEYRHLLEYPQYTRPQIFNDRAVPEVLTSGNHQAIKKWRLEQAREKTKSCRPDLFAKATLSNDTF